HLLIVTEIIVLLSDLAIWHLDESVGILGPYRAQKRGEAIDVIPRDRRMKPIGPIVFNIVVEIGRYDDAQASERRIELRRFIHGEIVDARGPSGDDAVAARQHLASCLPYPPLNLLIGQAPGARKKRPCHVEKISDLSA